MGPEKGAEPGEKPGFGSKGGLAELLGAGKAGITGVRALLVVEEPEKEFLERGWGREGP